MSAQLLSEAQICALVTHALNHQQFFEKISLDSNFWCEELRRVNCLATLEKKSISAPEEAKAMVSAMPIEFQYCSNIYDDYESPDYLILKLAQYYQIQASYYQDYDKSLASQFILHLFMAIAMNLLANEQRYVDIPLFGDES